MLLKLIKIALFVFILFFTYYIFSTSLHVRFWADDFCTGAVHNQHGFLGSQIFWWTTWSGRYSYNFVLHFFMLFGESVVRYLPMVVYSLLTVSLWPIFHKLLSDKAKIFSLILSAAFIILVLINTPNIIQSFYWYGGTLIYSLPFVFLNMFFSLLIWQDSKLLKENTGLVLFLSFILLFIAGGFNESFAVAQLVFLSFLLLINSIHKWQGRKKIGLILLAGIIGLFTSLAVMYFSPGASVRATTVNRAENLLWVIERSYIELIAFINMLINSRPFLYTTALILTLSFVIVSMLKKKINTHMSFGKMFFLLILLVISAVISITTVYATSFYSMSYHPPERAMITATYIIVTCLVILGVLVNIYLIRQLVIKKIKYVNLVMFIIFITSLLLLTRDTHRNWKFMKNDLKTYADAWDIQRESIAEQSVRSEKVVIKYIPPVGRIDGLKDNKGWVTGCAAGYFGVKEFSVE